MPALGKVAPGSAGVRTVLPAPRDVVDADAALRDARTLELECLEAARPVHAECHAARLDGSQCVTRRSRCHGGKEAEIPRIERGDSSGRGRNRRLEPPRRRLRGDDWERSDLGVRWVIRGARERRLDRDRTPAGTGNRVGSHRVAVAHRLTLSPLGHLEGLGSIPPEPERTDLRRAQAVHESDRAEVHAQLNSRSEWMPAPRRGTWFGLEARPLACPMRTPMRSIVRAPTSPAAASCSRSSACARTRETLALRLAAGSLWPTTTWS